MRSKKKIFSLRALIFAVLVTAAVSSVTLSRYMTTVTGTATAQVASFKVTLTSTKTDMNFNGSAYGGNTEEHSYAFTVESRSDVALTYYVTVDFGELPPPAQISLWIDDGAKQTGNGSTKKFTFSGYTYGLEDEAKTHTLYIQVNYGDGTKGETSSSFNPESVKITVTAEQITTNQ